MKTKRNKVYFYIILLCLMCSMTAPAENKCLTTNISVADEMSLAKVDFTYFTAMLPANCELRPGMMNADLRSVVYATSDNDFFYYVCFFEMGEDFDVMERLKEECDFDTSATPPMMLTVGGDEAPLLFYIEETENTYFHFIGVFADYINDVGIYINCIDTRQIDWDEKLAMMTKFRRPEQRKIDSPSWLLTTISLRQQFNYGSFEYDNSSMLTKYQIGNFGLNMPIGMKPCKDETDDNGYLYKNADETIEVIMYIEPLSKEVSPIQMLSRVASEIDLQIVNGGLGMCWHDENTIVYYTGSIETDQQMVATYLPNEQTGEQVRLYVFGKLDISNSANVWAIARSIHTVQ